MACPYAWHTSCGQAAALLLAFAVPLGNQPSVIFLRSGPNGSMRRDGLAASRPLVSEWGHHISSRLAVERSGCGESVASALCFGGARKVSAPVMSHFHKLFIDWLRGVISQRSLSVLSACLRCLFTWKRLSLRQTERFCRSIGYRGVKRKRNVAYNEGSKVLSSVNCSGTSVILFEIGLGLLEITFASGWCRERQFISGHGEILFLEMCVCVHAE